MKTLQLTCFTRIGHVHGSLIREDTSRFLQNAQPPLALRWADARLRQHAALDFTDHVAYQGQLSLYTLELGLCCL